MNSGPPPAELLSSQFAWLLTGSAGPSRFSHMEACLEKDSQNVEEDCVHPEGSLAPKKKWGGAGCLSPDSFP